MVNLKFLEVTGVYVLDRYCVGGWAVVGMIDSIGTESALLGATVDPLIVGVTEILVAEGNEASSIEPLAPEPETADTFRCCGPIKVPSKGEVTCCIIPAVLDVFGFVNFETFLVPSP